jgi:hypothetical protein
VQDHGDALGDAWQQFLEALAVLLEVLEDGQGIVCLRSLVPGRK